jgi:flagellar biosynthesis GTPase FlhF
MDKKRKRNQDLVQRTPLALRNRQVFRFVANDQHQEKAMDKVLENLCDPDLMHLVGIEKVGKKLRLQESDEIEKVVEEESEEQESDEEESEEQEKAEEESEEQESDEEESEEQEKAEEESEEQESDEEESEEQESDEEESEEQESDEEESEEQESDREVDEFDNDMIGEYESYCIERSRTEIEIENENEGALNLTKTSRGGLKLCHGGYYYTKEQNESKESWYWKCEVTGTKNIRKCSGRAISKKGIGPVTQTVEHNHEPDVEREVVLKSTTKAILNLLL